jgi:hypothetical protein
MKTFPIKNCYFTNAVPILSIKKETYLMTPDRNGNRKERPVWRFYNGQTVYARGWPFGTGLIVVERMENMAWPHYLLKDIYGNSWIMSQLNLSSKTIETKYS